MIYPRRSSICKVKVKVNNMPKIVIHIFHADESSLGTGSHLAERIRQVKDERGLDLEVYVFGPAEKALMNPGLPAFNAAIDGLVK